MLRFCSIRLFRQMFRNGAFLLYGESRNTKVCQHDSSQNNSVISKELKIMLSDIAHKELDGINGNHKGNQHSQYGVEYLRACENISCQEILHDF